MDKHKFSNILWRELPERLLDAILENIEAQKENGQFDWGIGNDFWKKW